MGHEDFQQRLARIGGKPSAAGMVVTEAPAAPAEEHRSFQLSGVVWGAICSAVVVGLFSNIQRISDLAPQSIRESDMPGLFGVPVAILTVGWFIIIPIWFARTVIGSVTSGRSKPSWFAIGAFLGMAAGLGVMELP